MEGWLPTSSANIRRYLAENVKENDSEIREATVWLFTKPVGGREDRETELRHWSLVFEFEDDTIRRVEGNENDKQLVAYYYKESPKVIGKYFELMKLKTSPKLLRETAVKNRLNYTKYIFSINNCQDWVKEFALSLDNKKLIKKLENHKTLLEAHPVFALAAASSTESWEIAKDFLKSLPDI